ncbi:MAG: T9SS type A sorting domain-containing protein, partial [Bacteroidota bacterium]
TFDVTLSSTEDFKLGSGLLYFNYNPAAFGENVVTSGSVTVDRSMGVVGEIIPGFFPTPVYTAPTLNDNTTGRFAYSWQQNIPAEFIPDGIIITITPKVLFSVTMRFTSGGEGQPDNICFESDDIFDDQTFIACPSDGQVPPSIQCPADPSINQLTEDVFNCNATALPVELLAFTATPAGKQVQLSWTTANEQNNDYFTIERSADGGNFTPLITVPGTGTVQVEQHYESWDNQPQRGLNYYRLKQVDFDGAFTYSDVRLVEFTPAEEHPLVFPNPVSRSVNVQFQEDVSKGQASLLNASGQIVRTQIIPTGSPQIQLPVDQLSAGTYWLQVKAGNLVFTEKIIVTKP